MTAEIYKIASQDDPDTGWTAECRVWIDKRGTLFMSQGDGDDDLIMIPAGEISALADWIKERVSDGLD